ncbi:MAG: cytochrome c peroxidase [Cycloclasticus sp.]
MNRFTLILSAMLLVGLSASFLAYASTARNEPISPIPQTQNIDSAAVELGNKLFHDTRFSSDQTISCASCHSLVSGGMDNKTISLGVEKRQGNINTPTVFNSKFNFKQFWDGRAANLMQQMEDPIHSEQEMDSSWPRIIGIIKGDPSYMAMFSNNYDDGVTIKNIKSAIVEFENTLVTPNSRFDKYLRGDDEAITKEELSGYQLFKSYGCVSCHQGVNVGGKLFQKLGIVYEYSFSNLGGNNRDLGRFNITQQLDDKYVFKVPSLRNIALTAPYLHDGSQATLEDVVSAMMFHQLGIPSSEEDIRLIVKFLNTLTGEYQGKPLQ